MTLLMFLKANVAANDLAFFHLSENQNSCFNAFLFDNEELSSNKFILISLGAPPINQ